MFKRRVYLDFASATPVLPRVARAIAHAEIAYYGNPSAPHEEGRRAYEAISRSREQIARTLAVKADELVFTSGGTEANNLAIRGLIEGVRHKGLSYKKMHVITTQIEHSSITEPLRSLEKEGLRVSWLQPDQKGLITPDKVVAELLPETLLITLAHVNGEVGVIQPMSEIHHAVRGNKRKTAAFLKKHFPETTFPVLHADCAQSPLYLDAGPHTLKADLVTYDAQKIMGPKGVGVLYRDFSIPLVSLTHGGTQERGLRPGTENAPLIVGAGIAFEYAHDGRGARKENVALLRDILIKRVLQEVPEARLVGHTKKRIANNAYFAIPGVDGDYLAVLMDERGVSVTPRSACIGTGGNRSEVVFAITQDDSLARGTIRFSLGPQTTHRHIEKAVSALKSSLAVGRG
jgi:cysteine desulfurase